MRILKLTTVALALASAFQTQAADPATTGMTPEQLQDFNRIAIKTEALEDSRDAAGFKGLKISGYMDPTYIYNANKQRGTFQFIVPAAGEGYGYDNSYFGTVSLDIQKETDNGTKFHLNLIPKRGTGDFNDNSIVNEASVWIPLGGSDTKLFAGQVPDWSGYEYQAPTQNKMVTHNLLFDFTLPYYYTGVGLELVRGKLDLKLMVANFNQSIRQVGESVPMFVFRGDYSSAEYWGVGFAGAIGYKNNLRAYVDSGYSVDGNGVALDAAGNPVSSKDTLYTTLELDSWYTRGDLTINGHVVYGAQQKAAITANPDTGALRDAQWVGVSALAAYKLSQRTEGTLRLDYLSNQKNGGGLLDWTAADGGNGVGPDQNGGDPNKGADKYAITIGLSYALNANVTLKFEYRYDGATQNVFANKDALTGTGTDPKYGKSNSLFGTQAVFFF
jgi:opacity protein-like surface antigen